MVDTIQSYNADGSVSAYKPITVYSPLSTLTNNYPDTSQFKNNGTGWGGILAQYIESVFEWNCIREGKSSDTNTTYCATDETVSNRNRDAWQYYGFEVTVRRDATYAVTFKGLYTIDRYGQASQIAPVTFYNNPLPKTTVQSTTTTAPPVLTPQFIQSQVDATIAAQPDAQISNESGLDLSIPSANTYTPPPKEIASAPTIQDVTANPALPVASTTIWTGKDTASYIDKLIASADPEQQKTFTVTAPTVATVVSTPLPPQASTEPPAQQTDGAKGIVLAVMVIIGIGLTILAVFMGTKGSKKKKIAVKGVR
jgi:hypothetical protein